jgi:putative addiction module CopG family antidote
MPYRNFNLTPDLDDFVLTRVESGRYDSASELVQAALRALDREEKFRDQKGKSSVTAKASGDSVSSTERDLLHKLWSTQIEVQAREGAFSANR